MTKPRKPKSKRTPVRLRHRIEKASAAKQRKQRKLAKSNPQWRSRLKKDPGIPNLFPYKDRILHEIEEKKRLKEEEFARKRAEAKITKAATSEAVTTSDTNVANQEDALSDLIDDEDVDEDTPTSASNPMSALLASARARAAEYEEAPSSASDDEMDDSTSERGVDLTASNSAPASIPQTLDTSRRAFDKVFKAVLSASDIVLYVLDARDPNGTRSRDIEREVVAAAGGSKRLLLILNKIDLVPPPILEAWLHYLRRSFPALPLRASTPAPNAKTFDHKALTVRGTSETLLRALKAYAAREGVKRSMTVGVIGYPNVGKSSVINALTSRLSRTPNTACPIGAEAGVTTALREVKVDGRLILLDSPGIVFPSSPPSGSSTSTSDQNEPLPSPLTPKQLHTAHLTLLSALPPSSISDPIPAITLLLHRLSHSQATLTPLLSHYNLIPGSLLPSSSGDGDITTDLLMQVARKRGRLGKGGVPNLQSAAMCVLMDWRDGRIRGWVDPPAREEVGVGGRKGEERKVVEGWVEEFKIGGVGEEGDGEVMRE
ncbi:hypothetical protein MMC21_001456 [Puttea exsequens]|nr:hypothetical protein [Puttea exsequens]